MSRTTKSRSKSSPWVVAFTHAHLRLFVAAVIGVVVFFVLPTGWSLVTRLLAAWDISLVLYLAAAAVMMARATHTDIQKHAEDQDEGAFAIMVLTIAAATASLGAIFAELMQAKDAQLGIWPYLLAVLTVILSWTFTHLIFALHYAYDFYGDGERARGLDFPETTNPDYWDFIYFSFVIGMTFQVSDVSITNKWIRRSVVVHGVLSFFFSTTIIALTVNMAANAF